MRATPIFDCSAPGVPTRPRVLYVLGAGKSGSTILGVMLGNCEDMFFTGELFSWLVESGLPVLAGDERAAFWKSVLAAFDGDAEIFGRDAVRYLERSLSPFKLHKLLARRRLRPKYRRAMSRLFHAITEVSEAGYVIDTSHFPMRAHELRHVDDIELYLLFLRRDPRDVVASYCRHLPRHSLRHAVLVLNVNVDLWLTYMLTFIVFLRHPRERRMIVRYEELLANPRGTLQEILDRVGSSAGPPDLAHLRTGYPLRGNRLLLKDVVAFESRPSSAAPPRSPITTLLQWPWILWFKSESARARRGRTRAKSRSVSEDTGAGAPEASSRL